MINTSKQSVIEAIFLLVLIICYYINLSKEEKCVAAGESLGVYLCLLFHRSKRHSAPKTGLLQLTSRYLCNKNTSENKPGVQCSQIYQRRKTSAVCPAVVWVSVMAREGDQSGIWRLCLVMELGNDVKHISWVEVHTLLRNSGYTQIHRPQHDSYGPQPSSEVSAGVNCTDFKG